MAKAGTRSFPGELACPDAPPGKATPQKTQSQLDSHDPGAHVTHLAGYEPDAATLGRISRGHRGVFVYLVLDVGRFVAHRPYLDTEEGSQRALVGVPLESNTHCVENF